jgi:hypothetical protein
MSTRKMIIGLVICLSLGVFARQLLSQVTSSSGYSGGSGSMPSDRIGPPRMPGQPDFERLQKMGPEEKMKYFQQLAEEQRKAAEEQEAIAMQQILDVNNQQWKVIEPRLKKVKYYREQAFIGTKPPFQTNVSSFNTGPGGAQGFGGGFAGGLQLQGGFGGFGGTFQSVPGRQDSEGPMSDGEVLYEEIQRMLDDPQTTPEQVSQKLDELRVAREKAKRQWIAAQQQLREVLDFRQQARLVLMGLLD